MISRPNVQSSYYIIFGLIALLGVHTSLYKFRISSRRYCIMQRNWDLGPVDFFLGAKLFYEFISPSPTHSLLFLPLTVKLCTEHVFFFIKYWSWFFTLFTFNVIFFYFRIVVVQYCRLSINKK